MDKHFELIVRALIIKNRKILVCQTKDKDYFFLPGGHINLHETMRDALKREIHEEMGARVINLKFIGGIENLFEQDREKKHEFSFIFHVDIDMDEVVSKEEHISFFWFSMDEFMESKIVPPVLKDAILTWNAEKETFFVEEKVSY